MGTDRKDRSVPFSMSQKSQKIISQNASRAELLAFVKQRHRAAGNKASRIGKKLGTTITGGNLDPRRDLRKVAKYNRRQLAAYARDLNVFLDRRTQFVSDAHKRPVPKKLWDEYKLAEKRNNRRIVQNWKKIESIKLPGGYETVAQRNAKLLIGHRVSGDMTNPEFEAFDKKPNSFTSAKNINRMRRTLEKRMTKEHQARLHKANMRSFRKMIKELNAPHLLRAIKGLNSAQFHLLWTYTQFSRHVILPYENEKALREGQDIGDAESVRKNNLDAAEELIQWAKEQEVRL